MKRKKPCPISRLTSSLAIASLTGAALLAGSLASGDGADPDSQKPPQPPRATSTKPETVEQRITTLKTALKITPDQETKWNGVAQAMRDNASKHGKAGGRPSARSRPRRPRRSTI